MTFTFCSMTYNHEPYIIEHLESIKYQILNYGCALQFEYILADDGSKDKTVSLVESWLNVNHDLFKRVRICSSKTNHGTVYNYSNALKMIETDYYKILAGDDLFYKNDIFALIKNCKNNLIITPVIRFNDHEVISSHYYTFRSLLAFDSQDSIKRYLCRKYKHCVMIPAPGAFVSKELIDEGFYNSLDGYRLIEDVPQYNYHIHQSNSAIGVELIPLVLYRVDSGISHKHYSDVYMDDLSKINKMIHVYKAFPIGRAIYNQLTEKALLFFRVFLGLLRVKTRNRIFNFNINIRDNIAEAPEYIKLIRENSAAFLNSEINGGN